MTFRNILLLVLTVGVLACLTESVLTLHRIEKTADRVAAKIETGVDRANNLISPLPNPFK